MEVWEEVAEAFVPFVGGEVAQSACGIESQFTEIDAVADAVQIDPHKRESF